MKSIIKISLIAVLLLLPTQVFAGHQMLSETDTEASALFSFLDLRERETFVQVTNTDDVNRTLHVQIYNVGNLCNENNFFDVFTPNDTHIYNMSDIVTNDGTPSGIVLPENAYGFVVISVLDDDGDLDTSLRVLIGNFRVIDNAGYEYRTNSAGRGEEEDDEDFYFNFSTSNGVSLSDIVFVIAEPDSSEGRWNVDPVENWYGVDVDIHDVNENPLSCRDVIFSCIDENSPRLPELLAEQSEDEFSASVARFEYGINEAIPHSRGGELLCPGNIITEGWVRMVEEDSEDDNDNTAYFIGLNNGNGRGSMDAILMDNSE